MERIPFFIVDKDLPTVKAKEVDLLRRNSNYVIVDVRSLGEWETDRIPGAVNIQLLDNSERAEVGTIYKQIGRREAVAKGWEFVEPKLESMLAEFSKYQDKKLIVYCWRGGLRSKSVVKWLLGLGFDVVQLEKGNKAFREVVRKKLQSYELKPKIIVVYGLGLSGKSEVLRATKLPVIDLEDLAQHRSSVYGAIGLKPRSQKLFEALLLDELDKIGDVQYILVEGESRRVGDAIIPDFFFRAMSKGIKIRVDASLDRRSERFEKDYCFSEESTQQLIKITKETNSLIREMGKKKVSELIELLESGNIFEGLKILLKDYYDLKYEHYFKDMKFEMIICEDDVEIAVEKVEGFVKKLDDKNN
ncbi:tRNA 2-selenouridine(34) synthase MnmH [Candidatus Woesearchaeota archaeon]|jgi:tRNA 2-selenouridine synthase|nr:tRNA 2-selenouridine(34) synthase MnmH [Candidatus Woesearchaeota archaeon]MBT6518666.1 tRNA 2-selenouridine(34) synthase MnmH [Candidatus Woesearchaeota archaeon]MBT7368856.1 tRNA 2-selenouridine(34) synthase MnmH [Candidatus Woesearchaeota archaeon]